jgi:DNA-directed RNA polymerase subunit K/omega
MTTDGQQRAMEQQRRTPARLTKFERTQLIGMRMEQIARGAPPTIDVVAGMSVRDIVLEEMASRRIPLMVSRTLPNGRVETWRISELESI